MDAAPVPANDEEPVPELPVDAGFTTAELLANAALAVVVLAAIWGLFSEFGKDLIIWMKDQINM
ncbi:MAG: hypothetical protein ACRDKW_00480 [Actinomycetota bacterium]